MGGEEKALADVFHHEIRLGEVLVKGILEAADLLGVVEPVPGLDPGTGGKFPRLDVLVHEFLHLGDLLGSLCIGSLLDLVQELVHGGRIACHLVVKLVRCKTVEAQQFRLLGTEPEDLQAEGLVVLVATVVAP